MQNGENFGGIGAKILRVEVDMGRLLKEKKAWDRM